MTLAVTRKALNVLRHALQPAAVPPRAVREDQFETAAVHGGHGHSVHHFHDAEDARAEGVRIATQYDAPKAAQKLLALHRERTHTQAERALIYEAALNAMPPQMAHQVARTVVHGIPPAQLDRLGRSGIRALRDHAPGLAPVLNHELHRRGPVKDVVVNGVHIIGDEVTDRAMEIAKGYVKRMTKNPDVAAALAGTRLVVIPYDERITDQDLGFELHDQRTIDGRRWDGIRGSGGSGDLSKMNVVTVGEENLVNRIAGKKVPGAEGYARYSVLVHEFSHSVKMRYLDRLPANDPRLLALLPPGIEVDPATMTGRDVLQKAFEYRKAHHQTTDAYGASNMEEWFAQAASTYLALPGQKPASRTREWLERHDPTLFSLLGSLYG